MPTDVSATLELVTRLLAEGKYAPLIDRHYPLDDVREAFEFVESGRKVGSVLLRPARTTD